MTEETATAVEEVNEENKEHTLHEGTPTEKTAEVIEEVQTAEKSETQKALEIMLGLNEEPALLTAAATSESPPEESPLIRKAREFRSIFEQMEGV